MKDYQTEELTAQIPLPESVNVAMADIAATMREGLLAMAVGAGLAVMGSLMEESVRSLCGPKGKHDRERTAVRHGTEEGSVTLGGRRVGVRRPRVRASDGSGEVPVPAYDLFSSTELLGEMAMAKMLAKLSTRRYRAGLEPVGTAVEAAARSTSKSAVSRRFVDATETALAELLGKDLSGLDIVALMVDGVHFGEHLLVVALGIGIDGTKHPLAVVEGSTENATLVTGLLVGLRDRGLDVTRPLLVVIDGSKALSAAVRAVFDHPVLARCQLHKIRNVVSKLPEALGATGAKKMRAAYRMNNALAPGREPADIGDLGPVEGLAVEEPPTSEHWVVPAQR
jgi:transposase-like protein